MTLTAPIRFLREVKEELNKVTWPTKAETVKLTLIVLAVSVLVGAFIGGLDFIFTKVTETIINK